MHTDDDRLYTRQFFQVFAATGLFMTGVALQFHFGQYIGHLGHDVGTLGLLLSISTVGTLLIRLPLGRWIDRFGCKPTWLAGTLVVAGSVGAMQFAQQLWLVGVLRTISQMAIASVMTAVAVFTAQIAPPGRRAESLGTMGLAGFLGMIIGSSLGDEIFSGDTESVLAYRVFFSAAAVCSLLAGLVMWFIASPPGSANDDPQITPSAVPDGSVGNHRLAVGATLRLIGDHWPGVILLIGVIFSMVFCLQLSFLERLAEERGFKDIKVFFLIYGPTAITLRIIFRRLPQQLGRTRTVLGGLLLLAVGILCLTGIRTQAQLVLPGLIMGAGHCFVFPSMVDLAAERLPPRHRGTGTSLIMAAGDLGMLIGFAGLGGLIDAFGFDAALVALSSTVLAGAIILAWCSRDALFSRTRRQDAQTETRP